MADFEDSFEKLPFDFEAEQSVLGAILIESGRISSVLDYIKADYFFKDQHRQIFEVMLGMFSTGEPMDFVTILSKVRLAGIFDSVEQANIYLTNLVSVVPTVKNIDSYAKIIQEKYYIRRLIETSRDIIDRCNSGDTDAQNLLDSAEQNIMDIRQGKSTDGLTKMSEVMVATYDELQQLSAGKKRGLQSGFSDLDKQISGLNKSDLLILAARPAMGKTSFALNIAQFVGLKSGKSVAIFSLEMSNEQLAMRMLSSLSSIESTKLMNGTVAIEDWKNIAEAAGELASGKIYMDDTTSITIPEMRAKLRRVDDLGLVIIDYLQLMQPTKSQGNRVGEISEITRNLKVLAKDMNVPVIVLSQLGRAPDQRTGEEHRPLLSDLRDSGSIEQDADIVMFMYRPEYYKDDPTAKPKMAECIVSKNRHGPTGTVELFWEGEYTRFAGKSRAIEG